MLFSSCSKKHSPVAQSVEQVAVNHPVGGSNPSGGADRQLNNGLLIFCPNTFNTYFEKNSYACSA